MPIEIHTKNDKISLEKHHKVIEVSGSGQATLNFATKPLIQALLVHHDTVE